MRITYKTENTVDAKETNTEGKHTYIVALCCGGIMEDTEIYYRDYQVICADSEYEAKEKYNKLNNCSYYYGSVIGQID